MKVWDRRRLTSWFRTEKERPEPTPVLEYRAPPGTQTIDNSEEFERFRRCVEEGKDPFEGRHSYTGRGIKREHLTKSPVLEYRAPPGTQTIDNSEEFERFRRCVEEGKDPFEGRHSYTGRGIKREHLTRTPLLRYGGCSDPIPEGREKRGGRTRRRRSG